MRRYLFAALFLTLAIAGCSRWFGEANNNEDPPAPPAPASIVVLYDSHDPNDTALYRDLALDDWASKHGYELRIHAVDVMDETGKTPAYLAAYCTAASGKKLPIAFVGQAGKIKRTLEIPGTAQAIIRMAEAVRSEQDTRGYVWAGSDWRRLGGLRPANPGAASRWKAEGSDPNEPLIPVAEWKDVDLGESWWVYDQDGYSSCCPTSGCLVYCVASDWAGLKKFRLSPLDAYARINGGRDDGATLDEFLEAIQADGVCTTDYCGEQGWKQPNRKSGYKTDRAKHRILHATWCPDWPAIASALQRRKPVQFGILVDDYFSPDAKGMIGPKKHKGGGGHAVAAIGMKRIDGQDGRGGQWYIIMQNSWGEKWGGAKDGSVRAGCCLLHWTWIEPLFGAWACGSVVSPSDDPVADLVPTPNLASRARASDRRHTCAPIFASAL